LSISPRSNRSGSKALRQHPRWRLLWSRTTPTGCLACAGSWRLLRHPNDFHHRPLPSDGAFESEAGRFPSIRLTGSPDAEPTERLHRDQRSDDEWAVCGTGVPPPLDACRSQRSCEGEPGEHGLALVNHLAWPCIWHRSRSLQFARSIG
jgi:hypothetical protein